MKRNILLVLIVILLIIIFIYPIGYTLNKIIFHETGGGFDVGPDEAMVNVFIGGMIVPPLLSSLLFGLWGKGRSKWILAIILSSPSIFLFKWAGIYLVLPFIAFVTGLLLAKLVKFIIKRNEKVE